MSTLNDPNVQAAADALVTIVRTNVDPKDRAYKLSDAIDHFWSQIKNDLAEDERLSLARVRDGSENHRNYIAIGDNEARP